VTATTSSGSYPSVNSYATQLNIPNLAGGKISATTTYPNGELVNQPVSVTVTYTFPYRIPLMASQNLTLSSTSVMYIVQ
jgi:hypothetical protein